jgi:hypothetical protein
MSAPRSWVCAAALLLSLVLSREAHAQTPEQGDRSSPWIIDASAGVPRLKTDDLRVMGDATLGYATPSFGLVGKGSLQYFDVETPAVLWDSFRAGGSGEAWYVTGEPTSVGRFEVRASGGASVFGSAYVPTQQTSGYQHDEDSLLARGSLLVGGHFRPNSSFSAKGFLGAGFQLEYYSTSSGDLRANAFASDTTQSSFQGQGRLRLRWAFLPDTLALRVRADGSYFQLTRDDSVVRPVTGGGATAESTQATFKTLEMSARFFVDVDALAFLGIAPTVFAGVDYLGLSTGAGSVSQSTPSFGLGLFKGGD